MDIEGNVTSTGPYIETVRSLHQTVIALRTALEESKREILDLKTKAWPTASIEQSLTALAIENHALRRKLLESDTCFEKPFLIQGVQDSLKDEFPGLCECVKDLHPTSTQLNEEQELIQTKNIIEEKLESSPKKLTKVFNLSETIESSPKKLTNICNLSETTPVEESEPCTSKCEEEGTNRDSYLREVKVTENIPNSEIQVELEPDRELKGIEVDLSTNQAKFEDKKVHFSEPTTTTVINTKVDNRKSTKKPKYSIKKQVTVPCKFGVKSVRKSKLKASICLKAKTVDDEKVPRCLESLTVLRTPFKQVTLSKSTSFFNLNSDIKCEIPSRDFKMTDNKKSIPKEKDKVDKENRSQSDMQENTKTDVEQEPEVDDIELIFTTDDTKESDFKEQLVSIDSVDEPNGHSALKLLPPDLEQSLDISDRELDDDVFDNLENENTEQSFQVFQLKRDNSQLYNSKSDNSINQEDKSFRSYYSYQDSSFENKSMEKDESFDRFEERIRIVETDISKVGIQEVEYAGFRRNTCPNPLQYRPLLHREAITKGLNVKKSRPILAHSNAIRKESGAQTDISALPGSSWRSESSLANKDNLGDNFTTLPSKFPLPGSRLKLSEKTTVEARRILLSDIGFTSMVPELSRSADHLCPSNLKPPATTYGQFLRTPELYSPAYTSQRFTWATTTATPSDGSHSHSHYSINPLSPPAQMRRCSAPVSPSRRSNLKSMPSKVRFANGSLPELRGDWTQITAESGDSTDSLVEEAENYLRRSIDCILTSTSYDSCGTKRAAFRRASAPVSYSDNIPPQGWQPFLPRQPRDLKLDHWVKVITTEGKVKGGRVRYIGPVATQSDQFVGVQLPVPEGHSDGTFNTRRYFQCEPYHGIFVPFKKVIMGWRP